MRPVAAEGTNNNNGAGGVSFALPVVRAPIESPGSRRRVRPAALGALHQPRLSLLGKPLSYRARQRDLRYRHAQTALHNFLDRPRGWGPVLYHLSLEGASFASPKVDTDDGASKGHATVHPTSQLESGTM
ncbi:hypothetical protein MRX96_030076 [Rhipicephalus microplus]